MPGEDAVQRMLQILGPFQESSGSKPGAEPGNGGQVTTVEDFFPLLGESYLLASTHSTAARMRARLFQVCHANELGVARIPGKRFNLCACLPAVNRENACEKTSCRSRGYLDIRATLRFTPHESLTLYRATLPCSLRFPRPIPFESSPAPPSSPLRMPPPLCSACI